MSILDKFNPKLYTQIHNELSDYFDEQEETYEPDYDYYHEYIMDTYISYHKWCAIEILNNMWNRNK